jgi:hypothetical protein
VKLTNEGAKKDANIAGKSEVAESYSLSLRRAILRNHSPKRAIHLREPSPLGIGSSLYSHNHAPKEPCQTSAKHHLPDSFTEPKERCCDRHSKKRENQHWLSPKTIRGPAPGDHR